MSRAKDRTRISSPAPSAPEASPKGAKSKGRTPKVDWSKVKVFKKPEYRVPVTFQMYRKGKNTPGLEPELWMQAAVESGLVAMGSLEKDGPVGEWFEPLDGAPEPKGSAAELEALLLKGIADVIDKLDDEK